VSRRFVTFHRPVATGRRDTLADMLAAAILAGGSARRLGGAAKPLLRIGDRRIIDRQLAALRAVTPTIFIVAPDPSPYEGLGLRVVPDAIAGAGSLGGVYTAIVESPAPRTIVLAGDMPFVTPALFRALVAPEHAHADLVIPRTVRGLEPLCAVYANTCAAPIGECIMRGELKASSLPEGVRVSEVGPEILAAIDEDGLLFANVNTPHDYARAARLIELKPDPTQNRITE
jgi:molybdenum cofactor guanylyltransferase